MKTTKDAIKKTLAEFLGPMIFKIRGFVYAILARNLRLGKRGYKSYISWPANVANPSLVFLDDYARISPYSTILNNKGKFTMGKYSVATFNLTVVPDGHHSVAGIPHCLLGLSHIHDKVEDIVVEDDVWIGVNVLLLGGAHVHRGSIVGANVVVNRKTEVPPYAVVAGNPARIIAVKFNIEQILSHEEKLYPKETRFTRLELESLFEKYYKDKRVFGSDGNITEEEQMRLSAAADYLGFEYPHFD